jgi:hypothetical protein
LCYSLRLLSFAPKQTTSFRQCSASARGMLIANLIETVPMLVYLTKAKTTILQVYEWNNLEIRYEQLSGLLNLEKNWTDCNLHVCNILNLKFNQIKSGSEALSWPLEGREYCSQMMKSCQNHRLRVFNYLLGWKMP